MVTGERGMADMAEMEMPLPDNTVPMMTGQGPFGSVEEMGGNVHGRQGPPGPETGDYSNPGWFKNMEHDEPYMTHVAAGKSGELVWNFNRPGEFDFACLIAGHYQAGMVGKIKVIANMKGSGHGRQHQH